MKTWTFHRAQWVDETTGYDCLILRHPSHGNLNGYVAVPIGHPAYGLGYDAVEVDVHGGLTFAGFGDGEWAMEDILNRHPGPDRPSDVWWFGFDCNHAWDLAPTFAAKMAELRVPVMNSPAGYPENTYRPWPYVVAEVTSLAKQLAAIGPRAIEA